MDLSEDEPRDGTPTTRGLALASVSLGFLGSLVFWWYPFGMFICTAGLVLGCFGILSNLRVGLDGNRLPFIGVTMCLLGITAALTVWRGMQTLLGGY